MTRTPAEDPLAARELVSPLAHVAVVGVDPSLTHTGVCVLLDGKVTREYALQSSPEDGPRPMRLALQRDRLNQIILSAASAARETVVAMESEVWTGQPASDQAAVQAVYQIAVWEEAMTPAPLHFLPVNPSHMKKFAGAQQKDQILLAVYRKWGREYKDHNLADAYIIAVIGHAYFCKHNMNPVEFDSIGLTKPQKEVLVKLTYPWEQPVEPKKKKEKKVKA